MRYDDRQEVYGREDYYWGTEPNTMAKNTVDVAPVVENTITAIDIGAGEGRDAVFFAEHGWNVYAMDIVPNGLRKAEKLAEDRGVTLETVEADANDVTLPEPVDVVYSAGTVQYIRPENRKRQFEHFKSKTTAGGIHAMFAFVDHPDIPTPPDWTTNEHFYAPGELTDYYTEWEILRTERLVFDDDSGDEPHQHAAEILYAQNPD
ncbi:SAM-dependent methyltransferase [Natrinema salaciae]|uniref:Tellurite methyltransferase n=1 Tax=Natrinema salaciae TaxID=1186196 RepID=A0A1H9P9W5_9EURY|nr:methyltransferase domain-containing protein [Natrinema salaciae]SER44629.1 tellurite methyltransferase [Natrinema salaciae]